MALEYDCDRQLHDNLINLLHKGYISEPKFIRLDFFSITFFFSLNQIENVD